MFSNIIKNPAEYNNILIIDVIICGVFNYGDIKVPNFFKN